MKIVLIAAVARNGVIGVQGNLPWHLPADLKRFKALTLGRPVIMGRKTWGSLPRKPLPDRTNIVLSRSAGTTALFPTPDFVLPSLNKALALVYRAKEHEVFVIGGAQIYAEALYHADRLEITRILQDVDGDTRFPVILPNVFQLHDTSPVQHENGLDFRFETYVRTRPET